MVGDLGSNSLPQLQSLPHDLATAMLSQPDLKPEVKQVWDLISARMGDHPGFPGTLF